MANNSWLGLSMLILMILGIIKTGEMLFSIGDDPEYCWERRADLHIKRSKYCEKTFPYLRCKVKNQDCEEVLVKCLGEMETKIPDPKSCN